MTAERQSSSTLTDDQFQRISAIAHAEAGLVLVKSKASMIAARLTKRVKSLKLGGLDDYFELLNSPMAHEELPNLLSALTTNVSHFFREEHHFKLLREQIIPDIRKRAQSGERIRIWSAGCSNGQELYSIAMTMNEEFPEFVRHDVKLLGTDIDPQVVRTANAGIYHESLTKGLSPERMKRFFEPSDDGRGLSATAELRRNVSFKILNLIGEWPMKYQFDVVFCRNVVIYFDEPTQERLWSRFEANMKPGAWLLLGHSERVQDLTHRSLLTAGITSYRKDFAPRTRDTKPEQDGKLWH